MKKILTILGLVSAATLLANAQGTVEIYNIGAANANFTNSGISTYSGGTEAGGTSGVTATAANGFYYALLTATYGGTAPTSNPNDLSWSVAGYATNFVTGGSIHGAGTGNGTGGFAVSGWDAGTTRYIELVGWSSNLGSTFDVVAAQAATGLWLNNGFFGTSGVDYIASGSPAPGLPTSIFGGTGLPNGITMFAVSPAVVPEPGTLALAALGCASLLLFRRRKTA